MKLNDLGWTPALAADLAALHIESATAARVVVDQRKRYRLMAETGAYEAEVTGRFVHDAVDRAAYPVVGDWVAMEPVDRETARIHAVLPRKSKFSRKAAGQVVEEQVLAANVDTVLLVAGLDHDFNPRRLERYLVTAWESGAAPVIVLNKADRCPDPEGCLASVHAVAQGVPVHMVSALTGQGLDDLRAHCVPGKTLALLGSSGVGKSSLINALCDEELQDVQSVRDDDSRGRHTTTNRALFFLPNGAMLIDTPGMREFSPWSDASGLEEGFRDVEALADLCQFRDCTHDGEPGCAIQAALASGELDGARWRSYEKLQREIRWLDRKQDQQLRQAEARRWKDIKKSHRQRRRFEERNM